MSKSKSITTSSKFSSVWIQVTIHTTVKVGDIKLVVASHCEVGRKREKIEGTNDWQDVTPKEIKIYENDWDFHEIEYMGMKITKYDAMRKFFDFHKEMGLDIRQAAADQVNHEVLVKSVPEDIKKLALKY